MYLGAEIAVSQHDVAPAPAPGKKKRVSLRHSLELSEGYARSSLLLDGPFGP